jgi:hypothetical protein
MTARCPSDLALEQLLLSPDASAHRAHVDGCAACQARLTEMRKQGEDFMRYVFPATVEAVEEAAAGGRARRRWTAWLAAAPALAAAVAVFLLVRPSGPPEDYVGTKGAGGLGLSVFLKTGSGAELAVDGQKVPAAAALRFKVRPSGPCRLWIVSIDATGHVSRLFPTEGDGGMELERTTELPGGVVLDGQPGPERILAVCVPGPLPYARVEGAIRSATSPSAASVRALRQVPGLPSGTTTDTLLLEKTL